MKHRYSFIILTLIFVAVFLSCRSRKTPAEKQAYKYEKRMKKENEKMIAEYHEHHFRIQPAETQQMMLNSKQRAKKINKQRGESWISRTFKRKGSKGCDGN